MLRKTISPQVALLLLATVTTVALIIGASEVKATERAACMEPQKVDRQYCLQCHTDAKTVQAMNDKRGF